MKQFITRAQEIGRKAADLKHAVQGLPAHAARIREAVTMTGGELQQIRADVQSTLHALRADSDDRVLTAMREINDHTNLFREAGYELSGLDLDMTAQQRLTVHLDKEEEVSLATTRSLLTQTSSESVRSILSAIIKAEETAANVELSGLLFAGILVHIGAIPMIRLCWRPELVLPAEAPISRTPSASQSSVSGPAPHVPEKSMFDLRPLPGGPIRIAQTQETPAILSSAPDAAPSSSEASAWSRDSLERFKKMPSVSKYGRP
jgi:hypothetical protein